MARNIFILGLDQHNLDILRRLPGAGELVFHRLLSIEELQGEHIDVPILLDRAVEQLEAFDGPIDAIVSFWDFPMVTMVPILCARYGLPSADLLAVLRCEHKFWARRVQAGAIDELPAYGLLDLDIPRPVLPEGVHYPAWIKPVNGASSEGAFKVHDDGELREKLPEVRAVINRLGRPFQHVMDMVEVPPEIARVGGMGCLVEKPAAGHQMTVEGFSLDSEVVVYGVIDSISYPGSSSFLRYQYPSHVPWAVQERMSDVSRQVIAATGLKQSTFNIEFFWDQSTDELKVLEINARHSQEHAPLFEMVDGVSNHQAMIDVAFGRTPQLLHRKGAYGIATKWFLRHFGDGVVRSVPTGEQIAALEHDLPGTTVRISAVPGERLSERHAEDAYSSVLASVYIGGRDEDEIRAVYRRCLQSLVFEIDEVRT